MKNSFIARSRFIVSAAVAMGVLAGATALAQSQTNKLRVGVYDSRAIAIAYGNSAAFQDSLKPVQAEYEMDLKSEVGGRLIRSAGGDRRNLRVHFHRS